MTKLPTQKPPKENEKKVIYCLYNEQYILADEKAEIKFISGMEDKISKSEIVFNYKDKDFPDLKHVYVHMQEVEPLRLGYLFKSYEVKSITEILAKQTEIELLKTLWDVNKYRKISFKTLVAFFFKEQDAIDYIDRMSAYFPKKYYSFIIEREEIDLFSMYFLFIANMLK